MMNRRIMRLAGPSILANITVPLVGMVDVAIAGRLGDAACIGAIAIATMLFDLLYWNFGFLRVGTGGLTAQAYGRRDFREAVKILVQAVGTALLSAAVIWAIQYPFVKISFLIIDTSEEVRHMASLYFYIRIWAAPATLSLFALKGWFIGMQNTITPMISDITVNLSNLLYCLYFAIYLKMGIAGIALGTLAAQYTGLIVTLTILYIYYGKLFKHINIRKSFKLNEVKSFFAINGNLFIRSLCFLCVYAGFTGIAAKYGDTLLAVSTIMMKLMLLYSYFIDGFAYAGEALSGRYVGSKDSKNLKKAIRIIFVWCISIGVVSTAGYVISGDALIRLMTNNGEVIQAARAFLPWLLIVPMAGCIGFTWDGIYIGATASVPLRNVMILSAIIFFASYLIFNKTIGIQALWLGYTLHLVIRSVLMTAMAKKEVLGKVL
ncbi:MAG TPA: MATE family efflux transporter [Bacteroidales bacterium]|jgi:MATE family multidrug resistance protein|nr:MATE family efflux transporter [Bacteroidales bacterium]HRT84254.1 MATE family efflux transporter [Bacteroidales bacterium]